MPEPLPTTLLEDAIDIPVWLEADASMPFPERAHRDREIARRLGTAEGSARVRRWWGQVGGDRAALPGRHLDRARNWVNLTLVLIGLIGGSGLALAAFRYDGTYPVNVVRLLGLLLAPQLILLVLNVLLIPGRLPGLRFLQDGLSAINPGALAASVYRQLTRRSEAAVFGWAAGPSAAARRFGKWQMIFWSQLAAVAFNVAVIVTAAALIAFTDLAFGWSTTLDVENETASRFVAAIARPWAALAPDAVPDPALVERSRFFRLEGAAGFAESRKLAGWWSFTVLAVVFYGLLPRTVFFVLSGWRLRAATRALLLEDARVVALLDRMSTPDVETRGRDRGERAVQPGMSAPAAPKAEIAGPACAAIWGQAIDAAAAGDYARSRLGHAPTPIVEAGSGSLDDDRESVERLAAATGAVLVMTPAWEPPLLEFVDFLGRLRAAIGPSRSIVVVPVADDERAVAPQEIENWRLAVGKTRDPHAYVEAGSAP